MADHHDDDFVPPVDFSPQTPAEMPSAPSRGPSPAAYEPSPIAAGALRSPTSDRFAQPDHDIECVITLQPARPVSAGALAAALHARVGKPLRWFGRAGPDAAWQLLKSDTGGEWRELAACLLLADRTGAATRPLIDRFVRLVDGPGVGAAGRVRRAGSRSGGRTRRGARPDVRGPRRPDRPHRAEDGTGDDPRHAFARRGRSRGIPAR